MIKLKVKEEAEKQCLNMAQLARKADIDQRTLCRIYRDSTQDIPTVVLDKLARALGISSGTLLEVVNDSE